MAAALLVLLTLAAMVACGQDSDGDTGEAPAPPPTRAVESQRPLTGEERAAVADFATQLQSIEDEWALFYEDFDTWMSNLTECLPSTAQERLRGFGAEYSGVAAMARTLPRTSTTNDLADLIATSTDQEETSIRHMRDRWLAGNVALFESVEQARAGGSRAQSSVRVMIAAKEEALEEGPSAAEVAEMEGFSDDFEEIAEAWDDFHDDYAALSKRESRFEIEELLARYEGLVEQFSGIIVSIEGLEQSDINKDLVDMLQDVAEEELDALEFLSESAALELEEEGASEMPKMEASNTSDPSPGIQIARSVQISFPAQQPTPTPTPPVGITGAPPETVEGAPGAAEPPREEEAMPGPTVPQEQPPAPVEDRTTTVADDEEIEGLSPTEQLARVMVKAEAVIEVVDLAIEDVVEDRSAEQLADLQDFVGEFEDYVAEWNGFYEGFGEWRTTNGGCDQVQVVAGLNEYSQRAAGLARSTRGLPQTGLLLPVYVLAAEASERDANAMRTLANTWTPFAVDSFRAVEEERVASGRLMRQASIALEELQDR